MAIIKHITLNNGVLVNYHRIVSVNNITNHESIIEIASYTDKDKREEEVVKLLKGEEMNIFIHTEYMSVPYDEDLNVVKAYDYLKELDKFKGCIND